MARYASDTSVSVSNSKAEIERIIERYGADQFMSGWSADKAVIGFTMSGRQIRFVLNMPAKDAAEFTETPTGKDRSDAAAYSGTARWCIRSRSRRE